MMEILEEVKCFIIMPFSGTTEQHTTEYWSDHFEKFLKPQIEQSNQIKCYRSQALREDILDDIISSLITTPIVVADLTDHNANVFWELGVRQSFSHRTITIAENGTRLPFDIKSKGTLFYFPGNHIKNEGFIQDFQKALNDCIQFPKRPDSLVLEAIGGRGTLYQTIETEKILRQLNGLLSETKYNNDLIDNIKTHITRIHKITNKEKSTNEENKLKNRLKIFPRIRRMAVEHMITTRYITDSNNFYELIEQYYNYISLIDQYIKDLASIFSLSSVQLTVVLGKPKIEIKDVEKAIFREIQTIQEYP